MSETKYTEAVLTTFTRLGRSLSLRCLVFSFLSDIALCSSCGLATAIGHINVYPAAVLALHRLTACASSPSDCFHPAFLRIT